jgi:hypothetical protein
MLNFTSGCVHVSQFTNSAQKRFSAHVAFRGSTAEFSKVTGNRLDNFCSTAMRQEFFASPECTGQYWGLS